MFLFSPSLSLSLLNRRDKEIILLFLFNLWYARSLLKPANSSSSKPSESEEKAAAVFPLGSVKEAWTGLNERSSARLDAWATGSSQTQAGAVQRRTSCRYHSTVTIHLKMEKTRCWLSLAWCLFLWTQMRSDLQSSSLKEWERIQWKLEKFKSDICFLKMFFKKIFFSISKDPCVFGLSFLEQRWTLVYALCFLVPWGPYRGVIPAKITWFDHFEAGEMDLPLLQQHPGVRQLCLGAKR